MSQIPSLPKVLIAYSSKYGQTRKIAQAFQEKWHSAAVDCCDLNSTEPMPDAYDFCLVLGSIHYGVHSSRLREWTSQNSTTLNAQNTGFVSINLVARSPQKAQADTNPYLQKFISKSPWKPKHQWVLAGQLDYPTYPFWDRWMIRMIMKMSKGPSRGIEKIEYTDWKQIPIMIEAIDQSISKQLPSTTEKIPVPS